MVPVLILIREKGIVMEHLANLGKNNLYGLEEKLELMLKPVKPNPEFVNTLRHNLTTTPAVIFERGRNYAGLVAVGAGLLAGAIAYWVYKLVKK